MKIYNIQAKIIDCYDGETSYRIFKFYKNKEKAEKDLKKLKNKWGNFKTCGAEFSIKQFEVIE